MTLLAGSISGVTGNADGSGADARFYNISGLAADNAGNIYATDGRNFTVRKITPNGIVTTIAGTPGIEGFADGLGGAAQFSIPRDIAIDSHGNIFVVDNFNAVVRKITADGNVTTFAGQPNVHGSTDGPRESALFNVPDGITIDSADNIYVSDTTDSTIRKISVGGTVTTLAGKAGSPGNVDAVGADARFGYPARIAADQDGNIFVVDSTNNSIRKVTPSGAVTTLAGNRAIAGYEDGPGKTALFFNPWGIAVSKDGTIYVADNGNGKIRKILPSGEVSTLVWSGNVAVQPLAITIDGRGQIITSNLAAVFAISNQ
jgi:catechol 2,3-dioxygenase-like lactoylglutathione lyase family enzyme